MDKADMDRKTYLQQITDGFATGRVVAILGPRQCGKTTLARRYFAHHNAPKENYFDLENPLEADLLQDPLLALTSLEGVTVIDEIQRSPEIFKVLRVLVDRTPLKQRFLILSSASRELIQQSTESLAGRIHYLELPPFTLSETGNLKNLWLRGGFPLSYLADTVQNSMQWRQDYIRTFLEQDIPNLGITIPANRMRRFWMMIAHHHGQLFNASELGNSLDLTNKTIRRYLDILIGTFMVRELQPWHENISKRQVKTSKIYIRDSGILHGLLNLTNYSELTRHPKVGSSWEGFALESVIQSCKADQNECYFWAVHQQAELDLLIVKDDKKLGFEFKYSTSPKLTTSMKAAIQLLKLDKLTVIHPGSRRFKLSEKIECIGLEEFISD
jgi:predicted AAA+ superfamily ATPase